MKKATVFLADGFEEIEAVTPIDMMRRAGVEVTTVGLAGPEVKGGHGITLRADHYDRDFRLPDDADLVMLPGGGLGTQNLLASPMVADALKNASERGILIAAICAAPNVLNQEGLLQGKRATAFPSEQKNLTGSTVTGGAVEVDGNIITGRSAGVALQFGHALIEALLGKAKADEVTQNLYPE